jgi:hypothetical protein
MRLEAGKMNRAALLAATLGILAAPGAALAQTGGVRVEHAAARLIVIPEPRSNVSVTVQQGQAGLPPLHVRQDGGVVVVDGGLERRIAGCGAVHVGIFFHRPESDGGGWVRFHDRRPVRIADLPVITARVPLNARVAAGEAVWGEVGPTNSLDLSNAGCGDWRVADVRGELHLHSAGSGDVRAGSAGPTKVALSGSGDLQLANLNGGLDVALSGSGDVHARGVNGPIGARIAGSGDISIDGGQAPNVAVSIAGSGDFRFRGVAGALAASIAGSGDVTVSHVTGPVSKRVVGSGDVNVGR